MSLLLINSPCFRTVCSVLVCFFILAAAPVFSQCLDYEDFTGDPIISQLSLWPDGAINDMVIVDNIGWAARTEYGALVGIDLSNPDLPEVLSSNRVEVMDEAFFVVANETHAYVSYWQWGGISAVRIFDISDPLNPIDEGFFYYPAMGLILGMDLVGDRLYIASKNYSGAGLIIADISTPSEPTLLGAEILQNATRVNVVGNFALVCNENWRPYVVDISDPETPAWVAFLDSENGSKDLTIVGNIAYVATGSSLDIVDVNDPVSSFLLGSINLPDIVYHVSVVGAFAYVSCRDNGVQVVDISQPENPVLHGVIDVPGFPYSSVPNGDRVYSVVSGMALYVTPAQCPLVPSSVEQIPSTMAFSLETSPNPFNPRTILSFQLPNDAVVSLEVYDVAGHLVRTLFQGESLVQDTYSQVWDGLDSRGRQVSSGVFYAVLRVGNDVATLPMTLLR